MSRQQRALLGILLATTVAISGFGFATAQGDAPEGDGEVGAADGEAEVRRGANLSPEQRRTKIGEIQQRYENSSRRVSSQLDEARQENDLIKVTCINDKLTQINANGRTLQQRITNFDDAVQAADTGRANHEYTVIIVVGQKLLVLDREAAQCLGQDIYETGATAVVTEIDPDNPEEDPTIIVPPGSEVFPFFPGPETSGM